jgi:hypothetical protein
MQQQHQWGHVLLIIVFVFIPLNANAVESVTVAMFDFESKDKGLAEMGTLMRNLIETDLGKNENLRLVTRTEIGKVLEEQKVSLAGITDEAAPQIGKLLGAQVMIVGRLFTVGEQVFTTVRLFGTETSRAYSEKVSGNADAVEKMAEELAGKIASIITEKGDTLLATVHLSSDQIKEIRDKVGTENLPKVFVSIREQIVQVPSIDPAAQTEFEHLFLKSGFEVLKDKTGHLKTWVEAYFREGGKEAPPPVESVDLLVIGEGISEFASRNGDLVSFRSRLEMEVISPSTGKVLVADKENYTAVDLSSQIAGKTSLQEAAARIAVRIIPEAVTKWREEKVSK